MYSSALTIAVSVVAICLAMSPAAADVACVQSELTTAGYKPGPVDGALGKRTVSAAMKMGEDYKLDLAKLNKATSEDWCTALKETNEAALITTEEDFREKIVGKKFTLKKNWFVINEDGTMEGNFAKKPLKGTWNWEEQFWCRTLTTHNKNTDCQEWRLTPIGARVARDKGKGKVFVYKLAD